MGSGKSTYGKILSRCFDFKFIDLDDIIVKSENMSVRDIFLQKGEQVFREIEKNSLRRVSGINENIIVAVGGGTPCFFNNMDYMNRTGKTVYLKASVDTLVKNLKENGIEKRPLLVGKSDNELIAYVSAMLAERSKYYLKAKYILETDNISLENIKEAFLKAVDFF